MFTNSKLRKLADSLTLLRAIISLPLIVVLINRNFSLAWILLLVAAISDYADGKIARIVGGSDWGAKMDPLADKILLNSAYLWLICDSVLPFWSVWLLITRELVVSNWRSIAKGGGPASNLGKAKTIVQFASLFLIFWPPSWIGLNYSIISKEIGILCFWVSIFLAYLSAYYYLKKQ